VVVFLLLLLLTLYGVLMRRCAAEVPPFPGPGATHEEVEEWVRLWNEGVEERLANNTEVLEDILFEFG
jgi:hypothetical protein